MQQVISARNIGTFRATYTKNSRTNTGLFSRFFTWANKQEKNRFLWLGIALMGGIGTILPLTLMAIVFGANNNFILWMITCFINVPILFTNLSAQPTKVTIPVLFFAWLSDAIIIAYCTTAYFIGLM